MYCRFLIIFANNHRIFHIVDILYFNIIFTLTLTIYVYLRQDIVY